MSKKKLRFTRYQGDPRNGPVRVIKPAETAPSNVKAAAKRQRHRQFNDLPDVYKADYGNYMARLRSIQREEF